MVRDSVRPTSSIQPRKQRKARIHAPKSRRRKMMASPLSRELRERNEFYPRRLPVRKGDVVQVKRGGFQGHEGKVIKVDLKTMKVHVDGVVYQKADSKSIPKPIDPSNIEIIKLDLSDRRRKKKFERILRESDMSEEEITSAEEDLEALESIEVAALQEQGEDLSDDVDVPDRPAGEPDDDPEDGDARDDMDGRETSDKSGTPETPDRADNGADRERTSRVKSGNAFDTENSYPDRSLDGSGMERTDEEADKGTRTEASA